jgi:hypothetical protein
MIPITELPRVGESYRLAHHHQGSVFFHDAKVVHVVKFLDRGAYVYFDKEPHPVYWFPPVSVS